MPYATPLSIHELVARTARIQQADRGWMLMSASNLQCSDSIPSATYYCAASNDSVVAIMHATTRVIRLASSKAGFEVHCASGYASTIFALDTYATDGVCGGGRWAAQKQRVVIHLDFAVICRRRRVC